MMDDLNTKVATIENDLSSCRQRLRCLDENAQSSLSEEIQSMQALLTSGGDRVQQAFDEIQTGLSLTGGDEIDIALPESLIIGLRTHLPDIISSLETARSRAETAFNIAASYTYNIMDIGHDIAGSRTLLKEVGAECERRIDNSHIEIRNCEKKLDITLAQIDENKIDIETKNSSANAKRQRKGELEQEFLCLAKEMEDIQRRREGLQAASRTSAGVGLFAVFLAPVTGGASLFLAAAAGAGSLVTSRDADEQERRISEARPGLDELKSEIAQLDRDLSALEERKLELRQLLDQNYAEVAFQQSKQRHYTNQIQEADRIEDEVSTLDTHASATISTTAKLMRGLQQTKQNLDNCVVLVKEHSLKVQLDSSMIEQSLENGHIRKRNDPKLWKTLLQRVSGTLRGISEGPSLSLPNEQTRLLDPSLWNTSPEQGLCVTK
ncbi:hypothetical protein ABW21_db0204698 [Orbilia brochopaga]|nr:hypothetical protein ABW21_db0204698 [Drechslerella brochopaga]